MFFTYDQGFVTVWVMGVERLLCYLFCHLKIFLMHASECDGVAGEVEDELAVAVDADDVAFVVFEGTGEDAELHVVFGELLDGGVEEGDLLGVGFQYVHKGLHDGVAYGGWTPVTTVVY